MEILFTAATNRLGGNFDYNVYRMSDVTGGDLQQLTQQAGMIDGISVTPAGEITYFAHGKEHQVTPAMPGSR